MRQNDRLDDHYRPPHRMIFTHDAIKNRDDKMYVLSRVKIGSVVITAFQRLKNQKTKTTK